MKWHPPEVISRLLKKLENDKKKLILYRQQIKVLKICDHCHLT